MAITILAPTPAGVPYPTANSSDSEDGGADLEGDHDMRPSKRARHQKDIVTPGEIVTDDPQWMRYAALSQICRTHLLIMFQRPWHIHRAFLHGNRSYRSWHRPKDQQAPLSPTSTRSIYSRDWRSGRRSHHRSTAQALACRCRCSCSGRSTTLCYQPPRRHSTKENRDRRATDQDVFQRRRFTSC